MKRLIALTLVGALLPAQLPAWGAKGHRVIADIAASRLTPQTRKNLKLLLGDETLAGISTWPDEVRKQRDESYNWHFVSIPRDAAGFDEPRDCFKPQDKHKDAAIDHHNCVVDRIEMFQQVLGNENASREQRVEALKWLVHFAGDLQQPLHALLEAHGANDIRLPVFGNPQCGDYPCNLHWTWDNMLMEHAGLSEKQYVRHEQALIHSEHLDQKPTGGPVEWANESHAQARKIMDEQPSAVDQAYFEANIHLVDQKLALGGLRLAALLNQSLGSIPTAQLKRDLKKHSKE